MEHVDREAFYVETGNEYRNEFLAGFREGWGGPKEILSRVEYNNIEKDYVHLRASVWLDACLHAPVWWSQHQHRPWYIAGVDTYQVRSTDFATNRRFWSMMTSVKGIDAEPPAGMDELRYYGADLECRVTISGTKLNFFAVGSLENRRVRQHTYHTVWSGAAERTGDGGDRKSVV